MASHNPVDVAPSREQLLHALYEAAELEHCLMCTYLYAAFSLKSSLDEGLAAEQLSAVTRWRRTIVEIATEEMGHLASVWNITAALGGAPRVGRSNFPLDPGYLPAGVVVKLAPFNRATLQHFIYLERPADSTEMDGEGFAPERAFVRGVDGPRLTPMGMDYDTVGAFYEKLGENLRKLADAQGEANALCGDPALQLSDADVSLPGAKRVICLKTALIAFDAIVTQGEGAQQNAEGSHYQKFAAIREEYQSLLEADPSFVPAFPAATNPVLRRPPRPGRPRVDRRCQGHRHCRPGQQCLRPDAAPARLHLCRTRTGSGQDAGAGSVDRFDACPGAAGRARCAAASRSVESHLSRGRYLHYLARHGGAAARPKRAPLLQRAYPATGGWRCTHE